MNVITPIEKDGKATAWRFQCPGCKFPHEIPVSKEYGRPNGPVWTFNGNPVRPTFAPSLLVTHEWEDYSALTDDDWGPWIPHPTVEGARSRDVKPEAKRKVIPHRAICPSYLTDGKIQFLADCTHFLAGKTVPLAPVGATK